MEGLIKEMRRKALHSTHSLDGTVTAQGSIVDGHSIGVQLWDEQKQLGTLKVCSIAYSLNSRLYSLRRTFIFDVNAQSPHSDMLLLSSAQLSQLSEGQKKFFGFVLDDSVEPKDLFAILVKEKLENKLVVALKKSDFETLHKAIGEGWTQTEELGHLVKFQQAEKRKSVEDDLMLWGGLSSEQVAKVLKSEENLMDAVRDICGSNHEDLKYQKPSKNIDYFDD